MLARCLGDEVEADAGLVRRAGAGREHDRFRIGRDHGADGHLVVAMHDDVRPQPAQIMDQVEGEAVVIVDQNDHGPGNHSTAGLLAQIRSRLNRRPPASVRRLPCRLGLGLCSHRLIEGNKPHVARLSEGVTRIPQAGSLEIRPGIARTGACQRPRIGPVRLCAWHRPACFDLGRKAQCDEKRSCEHGRCNDGVYRLAHDT